MSDEQEEVVVEQEVVAEEGAAAAGTLRLSITFATSARCAVGKRPERFRLT